MSLLFTWLQRRDKTFFFPLQCSLVISISEIEGRERFGRSSVVLVKWDPRATWLQSWDTIRSHYIYRMIIAVSQNRRNLLRWGGRGLSSRATVRCVITVCQQQQRTIVEKSPLFIQEETFNSRCKSFRIPLKKRKKLTFADALSFCTSLSCRVCATAIYFSGLCKLGKHNLVLIIKSPGQAPEWIEANSGYICDVRINRSTSAQPSCSSAHGALSRLQPHTEAGCQRKWTGKWKARVFIHWVRWEFN